MASWKKLLALFLLLLPVAAVFSVIVSPTQRALTIIEQGDREHVRRRHEQARMFYERAAATAPQLWRAHSRLGMNAVARGKPGEALPHFRRADELNPRSPEVLHQYAGAALEAGQPELAEAVLRRILDLEPQSFEALTLMSRLESRRGDLDQARLWLEKLLAVNPHHWGGHQGLAEIAMQQERWEEAVRHYRLAMGGTHASNAAMAYNSAIPLVRLGRVDEAVEAWREALRWKPDMLEAHLALGMTLKDYDPDRARFHLESYLRQAGDRPEGASVRRALEELGP